MFLTGKGEWTEQLKEAWVFENLADALHVREKLQLQNVELYYCLQGRVISPADFAVPLACPLD